MNDPETYWLERWAKHGEWGTIGRVGFEAQQYWRRAVDIYEACKFMLSIDHCDLLLDFGCGAGRMYPFLAGHTDIYVGTDFNANAIKHADTRYGSPKASFICGVSSLKYNCIFHSNVFQHITDDDVLLDTLKLIKVMCAPGASLVGIENTDVEGGSSDHCKPRSLSDYNQLLDAAGFTYFTNYADRVFDRSVHQAFKGVSL